MDKTKIKAIFSIYGDEFEILDVTKTLNIEPTKTYKKGECIKNKKNLFRKETLWEISTDYEECVDINHVLKKILCKIENKSELLLNIKKSYNLDIKFDFVVCVENNETPAMCLSKETISFMSKIESSVDFDIYVN